LVGLYLTWQIEIRLNCQVLGRHALFNFILRKGYAGSRTVVPGGSATWFPEYLAT
jgi:hypothetical protein